MSAPLRFQGVFGGHHRTVRWVVGSGELVDKPIALINTSPRATLAQASLAETLTVMSPHVITQASISVSVEGRSLDAISASPRTAFTFISRHPVHANRVGVSL
jgi:chromate reductase, NAD(P)H dehydrogenase (quinone)